MDKRQLGKGGPKVHPIGIGAWSFAGAYGPTDEGECHATLARALDVGMDFVDTADVYGNGVSEQLLGTFIKDHPNRFKIATKAAIRRTPEKVRVFDNSPQHLRAKLEQSLRYLSVEHVELFYIHRREEERPIEDVMETLVKFKEEGKIGGIGFSEISPASLRRASAVHAVMAVQNEYSLWARMPELGLIQACEQLGTAFVAFSPLGRGALTSAMPDPATFLPGDFRMNNPRFVEPNFSFNKAALEPFRTYALDQGVTPAALSLAWVLNKGGHMFVIPGTRSVGHLEENERAAMLTLSEKNIAEIEQILPPGFAHGDRYSQAQLAGAERYC